jgi:hypothetical protein
MDQTIIHVNADSNLNTIVYVWEVAGQYSATFYGVSGPTVNSPFVPTKVEALHAAIQAAEDRGCIDALFPVKNVVGMNPEYRAAQLIEGGS